MKAGIRLWSTSRHDLCEMWKLAEELVQDSFMALYAGWWLGAESSALEPG
ncbi:MAG: hypothetical protein ACRD7E_12015 [Bryobacteraceae bacterium]